MSSSMICACICAYRYSRPYGGTYPDLDCHADGHSHFDLRSLSHSQGMDAGGVD
jgi:hypothetical protein